MKNNSIDNKLMEQYLSGRLSYRGYTDFEKLLNENSKLRSQLEIYKKERDVMQLLAQNAYLDSIKKIPRKISFPLHEESREKKVASIKTTYRRLLPYISVAAVLILFIFLFTTDLIQRIHDWQMPREPTALAIYIEENSKLDNDLIATTRKGDNDTSISELVDRSKVQEVFRSGDYKEVVSLLSALPLEKLDDDMVYRLGVSFFKLKEFSKATQSFDAIAHSGDNQNAEAYLLLSLLADGQENTIAFKSLLNLIMAEKEMHSFYKEAQKINRVVGD